MAGVNPSLNTRRYHPGQRKTRLGVFRIITPEVSCQLTSNDHLQSPQAFLARKSSKTRKPQIFSNAKNMQRARDFHSFCSRFACSKVRNKPSIKSPSVAGKDHDDRLALGLPGLPYEKTMPEISHYATCWGCPIIEQQLVPTAQYCGSHENTREKNTHWMCLKMEKSPATLTVDWGK
jgi:hypothetical protein